MEEEIEAPVDALEDESEETYLTDNRRCVAGEVTTEGSMTNCAG